MRSGRQPLVRRPAARLMAMVLLALAGAGQANAPMTLPVTGERIALVIGNAAYREAPLANPGNDARSVARLLADAGFEVDLLTDIPAQSMRAVVERVDRRWRSDKVRTVVFFYAGHGIQLDWRNFLLAVDARLDRIEDVPRQSLDVSDLLRAFSVANARRDKQLLVVLDSCRDNPFSDSVRLPQRGLTQLDAPPNALVAFSTSPGQVALDGEQGGNSFYTAMLMRELAVPFTPIEDALKRVRTGVLLATMGRQIPWESTSLESDFVLFPAPKADASDLDALEQKVQRELEAWNRAKRAGTIAALAAYLQQFPSGNFSQLAQHRLDLLVAERTRRQAEEAAAIARRQRDEQERLAQARRQEQARASDAPGSAALLLQAPTLLAALGPLDRELLAAAQALQLPALAVPAIAAAQALPLLPTQVAPTPLFAGAQPLGRRFRKGDRWTYDVIDGFSRRRSQRPLEVTGVDEALDRVEFNRGEFSSDLMGNATSTDRGALDSPRQFYPATLQVGARWVTTFAQRRAGGGLQWFRYQMRVGTLETVTVPAGTFSAFRIEGQGQNLTDGTQIRRTIWVAAGVNANIALEVDVRSRLGTIEQRERWELARYAPMAAAQHPVVLAQKAP